MNQAITPPPMSIDSEQAVLGAIMQTGGKLLMEVQDIIDRNDFYRSDHRVIWDAIVQLDLEDSPADFVTVMERLHSNDLMESAGGDQYIAMLFKESIGSPNIRAYAKIVKERSVRRELIGASNTMRELADDTRPIDEVVSDAQSKVMEIGHDAAQSGPVLVKDMVPEWLDNLDKRFHTEQSIPGLSTGFRNLDKKINGLQKQNLIVIAGRPSMGKTALAINIANAVAEYKTVLAFSMEMSSMEIITRSVAQYSKVPLDRLMSGDLDEEQWQKTGEGSSRVVHSHLHIDESPAMMMAQIRARTRRIKQKYPDLSLVIIDYLQLMSGDHGIHRAQQIADITRGLKSLAKELDLPVIALSQLNRDVDKRDDKHPRLSDLRESGSIEQDADVILFVYRDVVYDEKTKWKKVAEIVIGKQRNGPTGTVLLYFFGEYTMFGQMDAESQQEFWHDRHSRSRSRSRDTFDDNF
jgi:replicative DNA helicase